MEACRARRLVEGTAARQPLAADHGAVVGEVGWPGSSTTVRGSAAAGTGSPRAHAPTAPERARSAPRCGRKVSPGPRWSTRPRSMTSAAPLRTNAMVEAAAGRRRSSASRDVLHLEGSRPASGGRRSPGRNRTEAGCRGSRRTPSAHILLPDASRRQVSVTRDTLPGRAGGLIPTQASRTAAIWYSANTGPGEQGCTVHGRRGEVLDEAGEESPRAGYVAHWARSPIADRVEVVGADDDARLLKEALDAGELLPAGDGLYYSRSYYKDTARSEERTIVAPRTVRPTRASTTTGVRPRR